ncbi:MAG: MoaF N-terminal domain-containing protein, partial [Acidobacteriota bacterium]|nr:MoaF N-terminal domain-containing protein [Acidobacteriota bacterium]
MPMNIPMHRVKYTNITKDQIGQKLKAVEAAGPTSVSELSDVLSGKTFRIVTDKGLTLNYEFRSKNRLTLSENGGAKTETGYGALTIKQGVVFSHMIPGAQKGYNVFVDLETDMVTVIEVWFSGGMKIGTTQAKTDLIVEDREVQREVYFGCLEVAGKKPPETRHHLTNRLESKGLHWTQDNGIETLELYHSVASVNFVELTRHADYLSFCSPADYIALAPNLFIQSRSE